MVDIHIFWPKVGTLGGTCAAPQVSLTISLNMCISPQGSSSGWTLWTVFVLHYPRRVVRFNPRLFGCRFVQHHRGSHLWGFQVVRLHRGSQALGCKTLRPRRGSQSLTGVSVFDMFVLSLTFFSLTFLRGTFSDIFRLGNSRHL